jgi:hypothetical protein
LVLQFSAEEQAMFAASTYSIIRDGEDNGILGGPLAQWPVHPRYRPQLHTCILKRRRKFRNVADGLNTHAWARDMHGNLGIDELGQYLLLWQQLEHITLSDQLSWVICGKLGMVGRSDSGRTTGLVLPAWPFNIGICM